MKKLSEVILLLAEITFLPVVIIFSQSCGGVGSAPSPTAASIGTISITTPSNGASVATLPVIAGSYATISASAVTVQVVLYRDKDSKVWNGSSWVDANAGTAALPTSINTGAKTWQCTGTLPPTLETGHYGVNATLSGVSPSDSATTSLAFSVGFDPIPVNTKTYSWGYNGQGQLGIGAGPDANVPTRVLTSGALDGKVVVAVASGSDHSLALTTEGKVYSWGFNYYGQLGRGSFNRLDSDVPIPVDTSGLLAGKRVVAIAAGDNHSLALTSDGNIYGWGSNSSGQLGNNAAADDIESPVAVVMNGALSGATVQSIAAGGDSSAALTTSGKLYAWGSNSFGQLGTGNNAQAHVPVAVQGLSSVVISSMSCGYSNMYAITNNGKVYACGRGDIGALGNNDTSNSNLPVLAGTTGPMSTKTIVQISGGRSHVLALSADHRVYAWGSNFYQAIGDPAVTNFTSVPVEVGGLLAGKSITLVNTGNFASFASTYDGQLFAWGSNSSGNLAGATVVGGTASTPTAANTSGVLSATDSVLALGSGYDHSVMLTGPRTRQDPEIVVEARQLNLNNGDSINFGSNGIGSSNVVQITLRNRGPAVLSPLSVNVTGSDFTVDELPQTALTSNSSLQINVTFTPSAAVSTSGVLTISSNDPDESVFTINLSGTGLPLGNLNSSFGSLTISGPVNAAVAQTDGKVLLGGVFSAVGGTTRNNLARLNSDGSLDTDFNPSVNGVVNCIALQRDGKILIGGNFTQVGSTTRNRIARLDSSGGLDTSFDPNADASVNAIYCSADGTILVGGTFNSMGGAAHFFMVRLFQTGAVDTSFNPVLSNQVRCITKQADGLILIGGNFATVNSASRRRLARLENDGFVDTDFRADLLNGNVYSVQALPDGRIIVAGEFDTVSPDGVTNIARSRLACLNSTGAVQNEFSTNIVGSIFSTALQADGSLIIAGNFSSVASAPRGNVARLDAKGHITNFSPLVSGGTTPVVNGVSIQPDGKVLLAGSFTTVNSITRNNLAQIDNINSTHSVITNANVPDQVYWTISGGAPETQEATLEKSTNGGTSWTLIGNGVRLAAPATGWQWLISGSLPTTGLLRVRASTAGGLSSGSAGVLEDVITYNGPPVLVVTMPPSTVVPNFSHHDFGAVGAGSGSGIALTLTNTGGSSLTGLSDLNISGINAVQFAVDAPQVNILNPGASTTINIFYKPRVEGSHAATLTIPTNAPTTPSYVMTLAGTGGLPLGTWRLQNFGQSDNAGSSQDLSDSDKDGRTNLMEYALGSNPNAPDAASFSLTTGSAPGFAPTTRGESTSSASPSGVFYFNYTRSKLALADVQFQVEWSDTMAPNDWHSTSVTEAVVSETTSAQQVQATVPTGSAGHRFFRLKMTRNN